MNTLLNIGFIIMSFGAVGTGIEFIKQLLN